MATRPTLSVVLPAKNEAGHIGPILESIAEVFADVPHEVILVDGGSTDDTVAEARQAAPAAWIVAANGTNRARAVLQGFRAARGLYILTMETNGCHDAAAARTLYDTSLQTGADLVNGSRFVPVGALGTNHGAHNGVVPRFKRLAAYSLLPAVRSHELTDPYSNLFIVRKGIVDRATFRPRGSIMLSIMHQTEVQRMVEIGYLPQRPLRNRDGSTGGFGSRGQDLRELFRLAAKSEANVRAGHYGLVAMNGFAVQLMLLTLFAAVIGLHYIAAVIIAVEATILINFIWHESITFADKAKGSWLARIGDFYVQSHTAATIHIATVVALVEVGGLHYLWAAYGSLYSSAALAYGADLYTTYPFQSRLERRARSVAESQRAIMIGRREHVLPTEAWESSPSGVAGLHAASFQMVPNLSTQIGRARGRLDENTPSPRATARGSEASPLQDAAEAAEGARAVGRLRIVWDERRARGLGHGGRRRVFSKDDPLVRP